MERSSHSCEFRISSWQNKTVLVTPCHLSPCHLMSDYIRHIYIHIRIYQSPYYSTCPAVHRNTRYSTKTTQCMLWYAECLVRHIFVASASMTFGNALDLVTSPWSAQLKWPQNSIVGNCLTISLMFYEYRTSSVSLSEGICAVDGLHQPLVCPAVTTAKQYCWKLDDNFVKVQWTLPISHFSGSKNFCWWIDILLVASIVKVDTTLHQAWPPHYICLNQLKVWEPINARFSVPFVSVVSSFG